MKDDVYFDKQFQEINFFLFMYMKFNDVYLDRMNSFDYFVR